MHARRFALALGAALLAGLPALAQNNPATSQSMVTVPNFSVKSYLGQWYEIARLDHPFERGLTRVTSTRTQGPGDTLEMVNRGFDKAANQWREAKATARIIPSAQRPTIEVTYGDRKETYEVLDLAQDESHLLVGSTDRSALWILSRKPQLDASLVEQLKARAMSLGFNLDRLMMVEQTGG
jgi:apolipoprotein D and lipocalin family protein